MIMEDSINGAHGESFMPTAIISPAALTWPEILVDSPHLVHAPFVFWLVDTLRPMRIVVDEVRDGFLYAMLRQAVKPLAAAGATKPAPSVTLVGALGLVANQIVTGNSELRGQGPALIPDQSIDLLLLGGQTGGGEADETGLRALLTPWLPKMSPSGVVLLCGNAAQALRSPQSVDLIADLMSATEAMATSFLHFRLDHGGGMDVLLTGSQPVSALAALCHASSADRAVIKGIYQRLGMSISQSYALEHPAASVTPATDHERRNRQKQHIADAFVVEDLQRDLAETQDRLASLQRSLSWRLFAPIRLLAPIIRHPRVLTSPAKALVTQVLRSVKIHGLRNTVLKIARTLRHRRMGTLMLGPSAATQLRMSVERLPAPKRKANRDLAPQVLIIAEVSIPQCLKYRVTQKQAMLTSLGYPCTVIPWRDTDLCLNALQTHSVVVFYRVPAMEEVLTMIKEAKALAIPSFWEVDDIIFDERMYLSNDNLQDLSSEARSGLMQGVVLYREAMLACDATIASTPGVARAMREVGVSEVHVIENALDAQTSEIADGIFGAKRAEQRDTGQTSERLSEQTNEGLNQGTSQPTSERLGGSAPSFVSEAATRIVYGSGTKTHDADFRVAANALHRLLTERPSLRLCIAGELNLPDIFSSVASQIERLPFCDYPTYLTWLSQGDINIAPLERSVFNDGKSNIKFIEAAAVGVPSICSPRESFVAAIDGGVNGLLAETEAEWYDALSILIDSTTLRADIGTRARTSVLARYAPGSVATHQVLPWISRFDRPAARLRVLGVNVYFAPRSFGGATVVAEEMAKRLNARSDVSYAMFTTMPPDQVPRYQLTRYETQGTTVFGVGQAGLGRQHRRDFDHPQVVDAFRQSLRAVRPDVVHLHSIQEIGASIARVCREEDIPYVITLHDAWWICGRQFMVTNKGVYCNQRTIDLQVCAGCVDDPELNRYRQAFLGTAFRAAELLLAPSEFFRTLYIANGADPAKIRVNKNGIARLQHVQSEQDAASGHQAGSHSEGEGHVPPPVDPAGRAARDPGRLRLGYVGGNSEIKGIHLIKKALSASRFTNYDLVLADNWLVMGSRSIIPADWKALGGHVEIVPGYSQDTIDAFFAGIDVLLFPTQWKESFGLTVREALIRDVWVIATDAGGVVEDIVQGENGTVIPLADDGKALQGAIEALLRDSARLRGFRNPYKAQIRYFDEQADELCSLLSEAVDRHHATASA